MARTKRELVRERRAWAATGIIPAVDRRNFAIQKKIVRLRAAAAERISSALEQAEQAASTDIFGVYIVKIAKKQGEDESQKVYCMSVFPDPDDDFMWAKFKLDCMEGCMKFGPGRVRNGQTTHDFEWRGRKTGGGAIESGSKDKGSLRFCPEGHVEGKIDTPFGKLKLIGNRWSESPRNTDTSMWETCTEVQHELECVARWSR